MFIPELKESEMSLNSYEKKYADILDDKELSNNWLIIKSSKANYIDYPDAHLNNIGHRLYANSLRRVAERILETHK